MPAPIHPPIKPAPMIANYIEGYEFERIVVKERFLYWKEFGSYHHMIFEPAGDVTHLTFAKGQNVRFAIYSGELKETMIHEEIAYEMDDIIAIIDDIKHGVFDYIQHSNAA